MKIFISFCILIAAILYYGWHAPRTQYVLVCTQHGKEIFRSRPDFDIRYPEKRDGWRVNGGVYTPPDDSMCEVFAIDEQKSYSEKVKITWGT